MTGWCVKPTGRVSQPAARPRPLSTPHGLSPPAARTSASTVAAFSQKRLCLDVAPTPHPSRRHCRLLSAQSPHGTPSKVACPRPHRPMQRRATSRSSPPRGPIDPGCGHTHTHTYIYIYIYTHRHTHARTQTYDHKLFRNAHETHYNATWNHYTTTNNHYNIYQKYVNVENKLP